MCSSISLFNKQLCRQIQKHDELLQQSSLTSLRHVHSVKPPGERQTVRGRSLGSIQLLTKWIVWNKSGQLSWVAFWHLSSKQGNTTQSTLITAVVFGFSPLTSEMRVPSGDLGLGVLLRGRWMFAYRRI